jgi:signal transduction histidine kinase
MESPKALSAKYPLDRNNGVVRSRTNPSSGPSLSIEEDHRLIILGKGAAELAHQLNNSFDGIRRFLSLGIACVDNKEKATHYITKAKEALEKVGEMADSLLHFARKEGTATVGPVMLRQLLEDVLALYEDKIASKGIKLIPPRGELDHLLVPGDFYHVFTNLIKNAVEASPPGGVLRIETRSKDGWIGVSISDMGEGIPEHLRPRLFEPFFTTKGKNGTGLGLALSKALVERYGGTINCESTTGKGSTFIVTIPVDTIENG